MPIINMIKDKKGGKGEAYAFFHCSSSYQQIQDELPHLRHAVNSPSNLELFLKEGMVQEAREANVRYYLKAEIPNDTNRKTADELSAILNQAYQSPLFKEGEAFRGSIFYQNPKGNYVQRK